MQIACASCGTPTEETELLDDEGGQKLCSRCYLDKKGDTDTKELVDQPFDPAGAERSQAELLGRIAEHSAAAAFWAKAAAGILIALVATVLTLLVLYFLNVKPH
jgi:hypothetical protein